MTDMSVISRRFAEIGARTRIAVAERAGRVERAVVVDVRKDRKGEYFDIRVRSGVELLVLDEQPADRHLLLMARDPENPKAKFLCGHDERHWFTAAIPETSRVGTVTGAKQALKPKELVQIESAQKVRPKDLHKRRRRLRSGGKIIRQGEFMFVPEPDFQPADNAVLRNEVLARGGNPHRAQYLYREGGTTVHVSRRYPNGLTHQEYETLISKDSRAKNLGWRVQVRDPIVHVKGKVTHPEHATVHLGSVWHRVLLNTENKARAARNVAFID